MLEFQDGRVQLGVDHPHCLLDSYLEVFDVLVFMEDQSGFLVSTTYKFIVAQSEQIISMVNK